MHKFACVAFKNHVIASAKAAAFLNRDVVFVSAATPGDHGFPECTAADVDQFCTCLETGSWPEKLKGRFKNKYNKLDPKRFWGLFCEFFAAQKGDAYRKTPGLPGLNVASYRFVEAPCGASREFYTDDKLYKSACARYYCDLDSRIVYDSRGIATDVPEIRIIPDGTVVADGEVVYDLEEMVRDAPERFWVDKKFSHLFVKSTTNFLGSFDASVLPMKSDISELFLVLSALKYAPGTFTGNRIKLSGCTDEAWYVYRALSEYGYTFEDASGSVCDVSALYPDVIAGISTVDVLPGNFPGKRLSSLVVKKGFVTAALGVAVATVVLVVLYCLLFTKTGAAAVDAIYDLLPESFRMFINPLMRLNPNRWRETEVPCLNGQRVEAKHLIPDSYTTCVIGPGLYVVGRNEVRLSDRCGLVISYDQDYYVSSARREKHVTVFSAHTVRGASCEITFGRD